MQWPAWPFCGNSMKLLMLILLIELVECTLISKSILERCTDGPSEPKGGNGKTCAKKFVVSITLRSDQAGTESIYANINSAYDLDRGQNSILKRPFRVEIEKTEVIANYRVYYRGSANSLPTEHIIVHSENKCSDDWFEKHNTCGKYRDKDNNEVFDSQGFCCRCSRKREVLPRANASCNPHFFDRDRATIIGVDGLKYDFGSSAHCMNVSDLWYDVYNVESPSVIYTIRVSLLALREVQTTEDEKTTYEWKLVSNFTLGPEKTSGRSPDGRVITELQGDLIGARGLVDLGTKKLLIPSLRAWHEEDDAPEYKNGPPDWLLVDEHLIDLSGKECNKVGLDFSAFRNQPGKCYQLPDSCFSNQPSMLWQADNIRRNLGVKGFYMLHNYGTIHPSTHPNNSSFILRLVYPDLHNTLVTFRVDASDLSFVMNIGRGRIVAAESRGFNRSTQSAGEVIVVLENLSDISQDFNLLLKECFGREKLPSKKVPLQPGETKRVSFPLFAKNLKRITTNCEVQLYDRRFTLLGTARLTFSVDAPCFCFGICDCTCDSKTGKVTEKACPTPPPIYIDTKRATTKLLLFTLNFIGLHGIIGVFGTILLCLGMIKLVCGGVLFCRKSKAQEHYDKMREKGVPPKSPVLVKCSGHCSGALAAKSKMKRKAKRLRKMGKEPHQLDDWANMSFTCYCNAELADIRFMNVIKALCFFYYLLILPFIWLGKKIWWCMFADTAGKKKAAEMAAIKAAHKKGPEELEKLGVVSLRAEVEKYKNEHEEKEREKLRLEEEREQRRAAKEAMREIERRENSPSCQGVSLRDELERYNNTELDAAADYRQMWPEMKKHSDENLEFYDDNLWAEAVPNLLDAGTAPVDEYREYWQEGEEQGEEKPEKKHKKTKKKKDGEESEDKKPRKKKRKPRES